MSSDMAQVTKGSEVNIKYLQIYKMSKTGKSQNPVQHWKNHVWSSESFQSMTFEKRIYYCFGIKEHRVNINIFPSLRTQQDSKNSKVFLNNFE